MQLHPPLLGREPLGVSQHLGLYSFLFSSRAPPEDSSTPTTSVTPETEKTHHFLSLLRPFSELPTRTCRTSHAPNDLVHLLVPIVAKRITTGPRSRPSHHGSLR